MKIQETSIAVRAFGPRDEEKEITGRRRKRVIEKKDYHPRAEFISRDFTHVYYHSLSGPTYTLLIYVHGRKYSLIFRDSFSTEANEKATL